MHRSGVVLRAAVAVCLGLAAACSAAGVPPTIAVNPDCAAPGHPTPACRGVPPGIALRDFSVDADGQYVVTAAGTVIDGARIAGDLVIKADDVTIRNSEIDGTVYNDYDGVAHPFTITDSTVGPADGCIGQPGLNDARYVATRVRVRGHDDGFRVSPPGDVTVRDSYALLCYRTPAQSPPDGSHSDGIQAFCSTGLCTDVEFTHNTVDSRGSPATFMINLNDPNLRGRIVLTGNLLAGGAYTVEAQWREGPSWTVRDNSVVDRSWAYGPESTEGTCAHMDWADNVLVAIDDHYRITSVVGPLPCQG